MRTVGIICEYNPLHLGHQKQMARIRQEFGPDTAIVCAMSGNFVQRGHPALFDKSVRAKAAILAGADLVLELPVGVCLSSAEGFASGGVRILSGCCDTLSFGTESMDRTALMQTAGILLSDAFSTALRSRLESGCSFPAARQAALADLGISQALTSPNDILGVEYCKAILSQNSSMDIFPIHRNGSYHAEVLESSEPSATALRSCILNREQWEAAVPESAAALYHAASVHTLRAGERAILYRLRTMSDAEFEALPYGSEGLWRKLMKAARSQATLNDIVEHTKSKRYTRTRIDRMILCALLGITSEEIGTVPDKIRVLAFNDTGRRILREHSDFVNAGSEVSETEVRIGSLYGLFCTAEPEVPGTEASRRIYYYRGCK